MSSAIEWLNVPGYKAETWNPWIGCTPISKGCEHCWAHREENGCLRSDPAPTYPGQHYFWRGPVFQGGTKLGRPLHWREPRCIFVCPRSDLFHADIPFEQIDRAFAVMALCPDHVFIVLTKRPERMAEWFAHVRAAKRRWWHAEAGYLGQRLVGGCSAGWEEAKWSDELRRAARRMRNYYYPDHDTIPWPLPNCWLGTSVEDQATAEERIPDLLKCPAALRFVSVEPMLGELSIANCQLSILDWVICGGESGPGARPMHPDWPRKLRDDCQAACVPYFFKQHGEWAPSCDYYEDSPRREACLERPHQLITRQGQQWHVGTPGTDEQHDGQPPLGTHVIHRVGKRRAGRLLDGVEYSEFPEVARTAEVAL